MAFFLISRLQKVYSGLFILVSASGCLGPRILFLIFMTWNPNSLAFFKWRWFQNVSARLIMLVSMSRCSNFPINLLVSMTYNLCYLICLYCPWLKNITIRLAMLVSLWQYLSTSTFEIDSITHISSSSISSYRPYYQVSNGIILHIFVTSYTKIMWYITRILITKLDTE